MSGAGKNLAKSVAKKIDWDYLAKVVVSDEGKRELFSLRRSFDDVSNTLETKFSSKEVNIDWNFYRTKLGPKIVDTFKSSIDLGKRRAFNVADTVALAALEIPEYEDKLTPDYEKKHQELLAKATQLEEESKKEIVRLDGELEKVRKEKDGLRTRTVDEYFKDNPEVKEEIDAEIRSQNWG